MRAALLHVAFRFKFGFNGTTPKGAYISVTALTFEHKLGSLVPLLLPEFSLPLLRERKGSAIVFSWEAQVDNDHY